jgi:hypothetical protein
MFETIVAFVIALVIAPIILSILPWIFIIGAVAIILIIGEYIDKRARKNR